MHLRPQRRVRNAKANTCTSSGDGAERVEEYFASDLRKRASRGWTATRCERKRNTSRCLARSANGRIDILVGTQMVAKGHDFQRVTLVGVVAADLALGLAGFSCGGAHVPVADASGGEGRARRAFRRNSGGDVLSRSTTRFNLQCSRITFRSTKKKRTFGECCITRRLRRSRRCWCATGRSKTRFDGRERWRIISRRSKSAE